MKKLYIITISIITISIAFFAYNFFTQTKIQETDAALSRTGLVGHWDMDSESINGTTVYDKSGQGNHGTSANTPVVVAGKIGQAMSFNGTSDIISKTNPTGLPVGGVNRTISTWFYMTEDCRVNGEGGVILQYGDTVSGGAGAGQEFIISLNNVGTLCYIFTDANGETGNIAFGSGDGPPVSSIPTPNTWHHFAFILSGTTAWTFYLDGALIKNGTFSGAVNTPSPTILYIGGRGNDFSYNAFPGKLDDVRIYNYALSAQEIANLYNSAKTNYTQAPQRNGLVGHWDMDSESINGTTVYDKSGLNNNGTSANTPTLLAGKIGQAQSFNGTSDKINAGLTAGDYTDNFTLSAWVKTSVSEGRIITRRGATTQYDFYISAGKLDLYVGANANSANTSIIDNKWHLATVVINGANSLIYLDGVADRAVFNPTITSRTENFVIGAFNVASGWFNGSIDDVRVYNYALSAQEVSNLYSSAKTNYTQAPSRTGLVGYWNMDSTEIFGTNVYDTSGQNNHGTSANTPVMSAGKIGQAMSFNDSTDYINIGSAGATLTDNFTLSAWVKHSADTVNDGDRIIARRNSGDGTQFDFYIQNSNHRLSFFTGFSYDGNNNSITDEQWNFVTVVINGANSRLYVNGVADGGAFNPTITAKSLNTLIGAGFDGASTTIFNGSIDDVRIYNYALSAKEVADLYSYTNSYIR